MSKAVSGVIKLILPIAVLMWHGLSSAGEKPLVLGIHPYLPAVELVERFTPLADYLSGKLGRKVEIEISKDYDDHIEKAGRDSYGIAFMGPVSFLKMTRIYGEKPLLARLEVNGKPSFQGVIFVAKDSPVKTLSELKGKRFAFGDANSTMSHLVPRYMLWRAKVRVENLSKHSFMSNHDNVILGVLTGDYDAGAVMMDVFRAHEGQGLRAIAETPVISEHVFVASGKLDEGTVRAIREAMLDIRKDPRAEEILMSIKTGVTGLVPAGSAEYKNLRDILSELERLGVKY